MQVAVTRMAERANEHVVFDAHIMNKAQEFGGIVDGNHHVHRVEMLGFGLDYREKRAARRPYRRLVSAGCSITSVSKDTRFFANFGQRFGTLQNLVLVVAIERDQDTCAAFDCRRPPWG